MKVTNESDDVALATDDEGLSGKITWIKIRHILPSKSMISPASFSELEDLFRYTKFAPNSPTVMRGKLPKEEDRGKVISEI